MHSHLLSLSVESFHQQQVKYQVLLPDQHNDVVEDSWLCSDRCDITVSMYNVYNITAHSYYKTTKFIPDKMHAN